MIFDISDDELVSASQLIDGYVPSDVPSDLWNHCSVTNEELPQAKPTTFLSAITLALDL